MMSMKVKINGQGAAIIVMAILLILAIGYILIDTYQEEMQQEQLRIFQQAVQYGYEQAVIQIIQQASTCQPVPLYIENDTINIVAVECLQNLQPGAVE